MRSRGLAFAPVATAIIDAAVILVVLAIAYAGRNHGTWFATPNRDHTIPQVAPEIVLAWMAFLWGYGTYRRETFDAGGTEIRSVLQAGLSTAGLICTANYVMHHQMSRGFFGLTFLVGIPAIIAVRLAGQALRRWSRRHGHMLQNVLIVGGAEQVDELAAVLKRERWVGYRLIGAATPCGRTWTSGGVPILGSSEYPVPAALHAGADVLLIAGGTSHSASELREVMWDLEKHHLQLVVAPTVTDIAANRVRIRPVGGLPLVHLELPRWAKSISWAKRSFDVTVASLCLFFLSPVMLLAAWRVRSFDHGPVFYRQRRIGQDGRPFNCLKFRTMVQNADSLVAALQASEGASAMLFKMANDPRITKPGSWMRRYSIDELPQLINVIRGDMSLVGPRPQVQAEVDLYDDGMRRRLHVRPGLTGLWQVSGRSDLSYEDAKRLDLYYVDNWSIGQDMSILWRTVGAVFGRTGAY